MTTNKRRLWRDTRGTASVEVVMMLPFFILVYFGVYYVHGLYNARQLAMTKARACTWAHAAAGCPSDEPDGCSMSDPKSAIDLEDILSKRVWGFVDAISDLPLMPDLQKKIDDVFGAVVTGTAQKYANLPRQVGVSSQDVSGNMSMLCNTRPKSWSTVAKETFCEIVGSKFPGC